MGFSLLQFKEPWSCMTLRRQWLLLAAVFGVTRLLVFALYPMQWEHAYSLMQLPDLTLLKQSLGASLAHVHAQPPLFNMLMAGIARVATDLHAGTVYHAFNAIASLLALCGLYDLTKRLTQSESWAFAAALLYCLFPTCLLYERSVSYASPVMSLLILVAWGFSRATISAAALLLAVAGMALVVLMRSLYHWVVWMLPLTLLVCGVHLRLWQKKRLGVHHVPGEGRAHGLRRSMVVCLASAFFLLAGVPYLRNSVNYHMFTSSTWQGMNMCRALHYVPPAERETLIESGKITPLMRIDPFSNPQAYLAYYEKRLKSYHTLSARNSGIPMLTNILKTHVPPDSSLTIRDFNFNHWIVPVASQEYQKNFFAVVKAAPLAYGKSVLNSVYNFFCVDAYRYIPRLDELAKGSALFRLVLIPCVLFVLYVVAGSAFLSCCLTDLQPGNRLAACFILYSMLYVFAVSTLLEAGESCIMRVPLDPFMIVGTTVFISRLASRLNRQRRAAGLPA